MSTKTIYKRIALVAVAALGAGVLSVAPASAAGNDKITPNLGTVQGDASLTATVTGVVGGQVGFTFAPSTADEVFITTDGKSTIVSASANSGTNPATVNGVSFADGAKWTPSDDTKIATVKLTSATVGTSIVTIAKIAATTGVRSQVATLTITWASGTNTNLASVSAVMVATQGACTYAAVAGVASINYLNGSAYLCIKATNGAGTAYTQNEPTIAVIGNGITSLTSNKTAVTAPSMGTDGFQDVLINANALSGKATYTISASATNADGLTTSTQTVTATLNVHGTFTTLTLANVNASILHSGGAVSPISIVATDKDAIPTTLNWGTDIEETIWIESDKGTKAVSADAPSNTTSTTAAAGANAGLTATGASDALGRIQVTPTSSKYEKLTIWVSGKNAAGATITSNKVVVFVSTNVVKSLVLDATAAATGGMTYKVQALTDPTTTGTAYPVVDGETVTLGASAGILTANSVATDKTGFASTTLYPPALGSTVTLYATTGSGATLVSGSKSIANTVTSEISSLTTLVNSLIAKINALNKLVIKIQKKVRA
jgi:hypothetical protein